MNLLQCIPDKRFFISEFSPELALRENMDDNRELTQIIYMQAGGSIMVDFTKFHMTGPGILFIRPGQFIELNSESTGIAIAYTRNIYSSDIGDDELIFGGTLFNGTEQIPYLNLDLPSAELISIFITQLIKEVEYPDSNQDSMIKSLLRQLIITCNRVWRKQYGSRHPEYDFYHYFDRLVERNFSRHHSVSAYAQMLNISPKALNKRVAKYSCLSPSDIIHKRIILEAKRLLIHTPMTVKEIGYRLGYDDPSYFIRFFSKQVTVAPQNFRKQFQSSLHAVA